MKNRLLLLSSVIFITCILSQPLFSQENITLKGQLFNIETEEPVMQILL